MNKIQIFFDEENQLLSALKEIDNALDLSEKSLLKNSELEQIELRTKERLEKGLDKDSLVYREYDRYKSKTHYKDAHPGPYVDSSYANSILGELRTIIVKSLGESDRITKDQTFIDKGNPYEGRKLLRDILSSANKTIEIQDNYPGESDQSLLPIIEPYLKNNSELKIRILADKMSETFLSDFRLFALQYKERAEIRQHGNSHGRFVILDEIDVYQFGSSLKDVGKKADFVTKITDKDLIEKTIKEFNSWFKDAKDSLLVKSSQPPRLKISLAQEEVVWNNYATDTFGIWNSFLLILNIDNTENKNPEYISASLKADSFEAEFFIFEKSGQKADEKFEIPAGKYLENVKVFLSDHKCYNSQRDPHVPKPSGYSTDTLRLILTPLRGSSIEIKINPGWVSDGQ